jgi:short-subunit dehydrogenase
VFSFSGKRVWLTGASSGIGEALALELARRGAHLALTARRGDLLSQLCGEIQRQGGTAQPYPADVCDEATLRQTVASIETQLGPIDMVIANAGTHTPSDPVNFNGAEYKNIMNLNFGGTINTVEAVLPKMLARGAGRVVAVASLAGMRGLPTAAAYGASKAAMINFFESARFHVRRKGIGVTIVNPGFVKTPLTDKNEFRMPFLIDSPRAARIIADGLERERNEISFPFPFNWIVKSGRFLPHPLYQWLVDKMW